MIILIIYKLINYIIVEFVIFVKYRNITYHTILRYHGNQKSILACSDDNDKFVKIVEFVISDYILLPWQLEIFISVFSHNDYNDVSKTFYKNH